MVMLFGDAARQIVGCDYAVRWDGLSDMLDSMEAAQAGPSNADITSDTVTRYRNNPSNNEVGAQLRTFADSIKNLAPAIFEKSDKTRTRVWSDDGSDLSVEKYIGGDEACWASIRRPRRQTRTIRIMAEISATGHSTSEEHTARCGALIVLGEWLESQGYAVEIHAADYSTGFFPGGKEGSELGTVVVKTTTEEIDPSKLAAMLCSQDFGFNALLRATVHACPVMTNSYWGMIRNIPANVLANLGVDVSAPRAITTEEQALAWIVTTAQTLGIPM